jgi:hypothetical protein
MIFQCLVFTLDVGTRFAPNSVQRWFFSQLTEEAMKLKSLVAMAVVGTFAWSGAHALDRAHTAQPVHAAQIEAPYHLALPEYLPLTVSEVPASMSTMNSLDWFTGGYQGWGPMANPMTPINVSESRPTEYFDIMNERALHVAAVEGERQQVWAANAPLRAPYEATAVGATPARPGGGILQFFRR